LHPKVQRPDFSPTQSAYAAFFSAASSGPTISSIDQTRSLMPAAIAGVMLSVLVMEAHSCLVR